MVSAEVTTTFLGRFQHEAENYNNKNLNAQFLNNLQFCTARQLREGESRQVCLKRDSTIGIHFFGRIKKTRKSNETYQHFQLRISNIYWVLELTLLDFMDSNFIQLY